MVQLSSAPTSNIASNNGQNGPNGRNQITSLTLDVGGMKCAGCVAAVERQLGQLTGVTDSQVNLVTAVAVVHYELGTVEPQAIAEHLSQRGFPSQIRQGHGGIKLLNKQNGQGENVNWGLAVALLLLLLSGLGHLSHFGGPMIPFFHHPVFHWGLATLAIAVPGREIFLDGWRGLRFGHANMNTLVALGTGSAYLTSCIAWAWPGLGWECFFDEPVMLLGVLLLGRTLESKARQKAKSALTELLALQPSLARLVGRGKAQEQTGIEIPVEQVRVGEWVQVLPGEKIPVDGILVAGKTMVDESLLTGESLPVQKNVDDAVIAGAWNQSGAITVIATHVGSETTLARIIQLVETAQTQKAPMQRLADKVAGWFAYGVMAIALVTLAFWALVGQSLFPEMIAETGLSPLLLALKLSVSVLVVACPCALGLATPTAILVGTSLGAEQGILIKGGNILEILQRTTVIAFDKTGTLTQGNLRLTDTVPVADITGIELLTLAASVEQGTRHPLAQGLISSAQGLELLPVENIETTPGQGVQGWCQGDRLMVGNQQWLMEEGVQWDDQWQTGADQLSQQGKTVIFVARNQDLQGFLALQDTLRPEAKNTIAQLKHWGITPLLLTGDHPAIAQAIATEVGIAEFQAQMTPQAKVAKIKTLQELNPISVIAMVGDGINDAPALAQADVGISLSGATAVAMETADVVLMRSQLSDVLKALTLSRYTVAKIQQNLLWALGYNLLAIPLAAGAFLPGFAIVLTPAIAAAMMASSSTVVVLNALGLKYQFSNSLSRPTDRASLSN
ncbi:MULTISPECIES: cation-translocating P-type ATPase [unclassified Synechocystis]|uniref:heavy metal translocating P-type ATPase n=1 Tax=unclassified Synechocystis TaxID=2640012 RepID=UPI00040A54A9|nr:MULTISPECIES: cation-translocating P-type ATPase [unclassified Synechocystis]AIE75512.1 Lead, cadmium, zinc and mercury transporting ATPase; Copper-translocating P-type ATPase [Synechocystis sp. PCC 6714]MCT0253726.1 cation-translocating P-type ATPase [Synechocystis sp. CS-94]